jgi:hypothetical protein
MRQRYSCHCTRTKENKLRFAIKLELLGDVPILILLNLVLQIKIRACLYPMFREKAEHKTT